MKDRIPTESRLTVEQRREIVAMTNVSAPYLYQCLTNRRDMKPADARRLEEMTGGKVTRRDLCQKEWAGIWPELATEHGAAPSVALAEPEARIHSPG